MSKETSLEDVRLVLAIGETGSIGGAAVLLHVSQPSASQRLTVLERRIGVELIERDTTGARLTPAGELFAERGRRAVDLVDEAVASARSPDGMRLRVGTIGSLAPVVFPALQRVVPDHVIEHDTDHGRHLALSVSDGVLDAAVMGVGSTESPAPGVRRTLLGRDPIVLMGDLPHSGSRRRPLADRVVVVATYSEPAVVTDKVIRLGARAVRAASTTTAVALARQEGWLAAVPRTTLAAHGISSDKESRLRLGLDSPIWLVTRSPRSAVLVDRADELGRRMRLHRRGGAG